MSCSARDFTLSGARLRVTAATGKAKPLVPLPPVGRSAANILIAGVGGTGIVTVSQILGTAAHLDGSHVSTLDMTGLAQKGGAVVSHVRISPAGETHPATGIPMTGADVLIGADAVTAAGRDVLRLASAKKTHVLLNTHLVPTAEFVLRQREGFDFDQFQDRLQEHAKHLATVDANAATETLFGSSAYANIFLLGYAFQGGGIPVSLDALQRAITLNGVAVEKNLAAFRHGRATAHAAQSSTAGSAVRRHRLRTGAMQPPRSANLDDRIATRCTFLTEYQDQDLAARYRELVERVRDLETRMKPGSSALVEAVAESYFKLLAAKDEYEVARLFTLSPTPADRDFTARLRGLFEPGFRPTFYFAPPILARKRADGRPKKIAVGSWILPILRLLAKMRRCRGGVFDPFRFSAERRLDRALLTRFETDVEAITARLDVTNFDAAVALARLPTEVKGFGPVKEDAARSTVVRRNLYLAQLHAPPGLAQRHACSSGVTREAEPAV